MVYQPALFCMTNSAGISIIQHYTSTLFLHLCRWWHLPVAAATQLTVSRLRANAVRRLRPPPVLRLSHLPSRFQPRSLCHCRRLILQLSANHTASTRPTLSSISTRCLSARPANRTSLHYLQTSISHIATGDVQISPVLHCRVLPPGEFNGITPVPSPMYSESLMMIATCITVFQRVPSFPKLIFYNF